MTTSAAALGALLNSGDRLRLSGEQQQRAFGARLALALAPGTLLFLEGELGAGKTTLTQGLLLALGFGAPGSGELVTSPTYALMHRYPTPQGEVLHVDAYRVRHVQELYEMDFEQLQAAARLSVVEWGEALYTDFPAAPVLRLSHVEGEPEVRELERLR